MTHGIHPILLASWYDWAAPAGAALAGGAACFALMLAAYALLKFLMPRFTAVVYATAREAWSQPLYWVVLTVGLVGIVLLMLLPYNTLGQDLEMFEDTGLTWVMVLTILLGIYSASVSIFEEVEGRTALMLLAKPMTRRLFVIGKFMGVMGAVLSLFIVLGTVLLMAVAYKVPFEARELSQQEPTMSQCAAAVLNVVPGLAVILMETMLMTSIAVAISTRLPMLPNMLLSLSIYVVGHLVPLLANSAVGRHPLVPFVAQLMAAVFPVLDNYSMSPAIVSRRIVPPEVLATTAGYTLLYCTLAMLVALFLFEERDLA
ncbi:MAG: ABC transporter permease subunit [Pirellulales bacterium]|nr:ABC transporter permease subunit [Pirellulales bacterium]